MQGSRQAKLGSRGMPGSREIEVQTVVKLGVDRLWGDVVRGISRHAGVGEVCAARQMRANERGYTLVYSTGSEIHGLRRGN